MKPVSERNWADNHIFAAKRIHRPESTDQVGRLVAATARIRAVGTRHSFHDLADSDGDLIDLGGIAPDLTIDREGMTATVGAGTPYSILARQLHERGFALHNLASLPHISVAGAVATGTHGSGDTNGTLSSAVAGLEIVAADGEPRRVLRGDEDFDAMVVGLGAFGIVTRVTLDIQPTFEVRQDTFVDLSWDRLLAQADALFSSAYSVSIMTRWGRGTVDHIWLKTRLDAASDGESPGARLGLTPGPSSPLAPAEAGEDPADRLNPFGVPGPWSERLAHFRPEALPGDPDQIQSEYIIPRHRLAEVVAAVRPLAARIDPILDTTELRTIAADTLWLSPAYRRDAVGVQFTWRKRPAAVDAMSRELEALLIPLGARPHWAKLIHSPAPTLAPLYPRFADFKDRVASWDPDGKFRNAYLERHVFA